MVSSQNTAQLIPLGLSRVPRVADLFDLWCEVTFRNEITGNVYNAPLPRVPTASRLRGFSYLLIWDIVGLLMSLHLALYLFHSSWLVVFPWAMVPTIAVTLLALFVVGAYGTDRPVAGVWIAARGLVGASRSQVYFLVHPHELGA